MGCGTPPRCEGLVWHYGLICFATGVRTCAATSDEVVAMMLINEDPNRLLADLTVKQVEVLDRLLQHKTTKQIARELDIAPNTVDNRIVAVREKWDTPDRKSTARFYAMLLARCEKSPSGFSPLDDPVPAADELARDLPGSPFFRVSDGQIFDHWPTPSRKPAGLEALDARFGKFGRVGAMMVLAMILALTMVAALAIAQTLRGYFSF
jgi:DNA-binding CsgD family transcriptional regulator